MVNFMNVQNHTEYLYHASAKQLYNLALYAIGDTALGEQAAVRAFSGALKLLPEQSDAVQFQEHCCRLLYQYGRKIKAQCGVLADSVSGDVPFELSRPCFSDKKHLEEMLMCLTYEERFIVLLFCLQKYSVRQIAGIMRRPRFVIDRRLKAAVSKAMQ